MKAKVCIVGYRDYAFCTRAARAAEALAEEGYEVHYVGTGSSGSGASGQPENVHVHTMIVPKHVGAHIIAYIPFYALMLLEMFLRVSLMHLRGRFDVVIVYGIPDFLVFPAIVPKLLGAGIMLELLDLVPETMATKFGLKHTHPIIRLTRLVERLSVNFSDLVIAPNHPFPEALYSRGVSRDKVRVIMNVPDCQLFHPLGTQGDASKFTLISHGTIAERTDSLTLLKAVGLAKGDIPQLRLIVVGDGEYAEEMANQITHQHLEDYVTFFRGFVPASELPALIDPADIGLATYAAGPATLNILPTKAMEYISMRKPVIVARLRTTSYYFDDGMVQFYEPGNPESLAQCIVELYRSPEKRASLVKSSEKFEQQYGWAKQKKDYVQIVEEVRRASG